MTEGSTNLIPTFFSWWYGEAYGQLLLFLKSFLLYIADFFSAKACITTLFAPWKRDVISTEGMSLQQQFQVLILNLSSRLIGAIVKLLTLVVFLSFFLVGLSLALFGMVFWLIWPLAALALLIWGLAQVLTA